jgi:hypothetical protein
MCSHLPNDYHLMHELVKRQTNKRARKYMVTQIGLAVASQGAHGAFARSRGMAIDAPYV